MADDPNACFYCKQRRPIMYELAAAPPVSKTFDKPHPELQKQLDAEGRGRAAGPMQVCSRCYKECYADRRAAKVIAA